MTRTTLWNGLGIGVSNCNTTMEVMEKAGLDWTVSKVPLVYNNKETDYYVIQRDDTGDLLSTAKKTFQPIQNSEAFEFMDNLIPEGVSYEKVGVSNNGRKIWMLAKMPTTTILGDKVDPYMVLINGHGGGISLKACMTPVRVACQNTLNLAFKNASRKWVFRHCNNVKGKIEEAKQTFLSANNYMEALNKEIEELATIKVSRQKFDYLAKTIFPIADNAMAKTQEKQLMLREQLKTAYEADDLGNLKGTAWGLLNAVSDLTMHKEYKEDTKHETKSNRFLAIAEFGEPVLDQAYEILTK